MGVAEAVARRRDSLCAWP